MRRSSIVLVLVVLAAIGAALWWWLLRPDDAVATPAEEPASIAAAEGATDEPTRAAARASTADNAAPAKAKRKITKAEREEVRDKIVEAIEASRAASGSPAPSSDEPPDPDAASPEPGGAAGNVTDRTDGKLTGFVGTINDDFMPLAAECYEQALRTQPDLGGMLDLEFSIIADEEVGGLVDEIEVGKENQLQHEGMLECIRESMLSTYFPSPEDTGQRDVRLTMLFDADGK